MIDPETLRLALAMAIDCVVRDRPEIVGVERVAHIKRAAALVIANGFIARDGRLVHHG